MLIPFINSLPRQPHQTQFCPASIFSKRYPGISRSAHAPPTSLEPWYPMRKNAFLHVCTTYGFIFCFRIEKAGGCGPGKKACRACNSQDHRGKCPRTRRTEVLGAETTPGQTYTVDMEIDLCDCTSGQTGKLCKYQVTCANRYMLNMPQVFKSIPENRQWLAGVALGKEKSAQLRFFLPI